MLARQMELRHLRYFVAAAEAENVSRAALKLHVSQPALSRQIRDLEEELRFPLFERSAKSVRLTEAGRVFLAEAREVLRRADQAVDTARSAALRSGGELHVGYAPSPMVRILPATMRAFLAEAPGVRVKLHDLSTEEMLAGIRQEKLQLAFLVRPGRAALRGLKFAELGRELLCVAVAPGHSLARARSAPMAQVVSEPLVAFGRKEYPEYYELLMALFASAKATPRIVEEHDSASSLMAAIESGAGVAIVPQNFSCSAGPRLKIIPLSPAPEPLVMGAVWSDHGLTPAAGLFLKLSKAASTTAPT